MDGQNFDQNTNEQPVYQQPEQPAYQQPVYQQPEQPVYQQPVYQQPYAAPAEQPKKSNGMSIASMVLGIVGTVLACCSPLIGIICGAVGLPLGIMGNKKIKNGMATAGIVLSVLALVVAIGMWIVNMIAINSMKSGMNDLMNQLYNMNY